MPSEPNLNRSIAFLSTVWVGGGLTKAEFLKMELDKSKVEQIIKTNSSAKGKYGYIDYSNNQWVLTNKGKLKVSGILTKFGSSSKLDRRKTLRNQDHSLIILSCIYNSLLSLSIEDILTISLQKSLAHSNSLQPDLAISLKSGYHLYFEADTGFENNSIIKEKIKKYDRLGNDFIVIFLTTNYNLRSKILFPENWVLIDFNSNYTNSFSEPLSVYTSTQIILSKNQSFQTPESDIEESDLYKPNPSNEHTPKSIPDKTPERCMPKTENEPIITDFSQLDLEWIRKRVSLSEFN